VLRIKIGDDRVENQSEEKVEMRSKLAGAGILWAISAAASAQITVYGLVDTGVEYVTNANAAGQSVVKMPSLTGTLPSRIGFKGTEDLGGGAQALFMLENGFALDGGTLTQGNRLFGRQAWVGLKNQYGTFSFGRQSNMTFHALLKSDIMGPSVHAVTNMDTYLPNARSDNSIAYLGTFSNVTLGATYSFGRDASPAGAAGPSATNCPGEVPGNAKACRQVTALLAYDTPRFGVSTSYDIQYGNTGATNGLTSSAFNEKRTTLSGYALFDKTKLGLGAVIRKTHVAADSKANLYFIGVSHPLSSEWTLDGQLARLDVRNTDRTSTLYAARLSRHLSKRTTVYASLGYIQNEGTAAIPVDAGGSVGTGMNQTGVMTGVRHLF
jgi:predicted porin